MARRCSAVLATMVAKIGVDLLKPWPLKVLVDHGLSAHPLTPALAGLLAALPGRRLARRA